MVMHSCLPTPLHLTLTESMLPSLWQLIYLEPAQSYLAPHHNMPRQLPSMSSSHCGKILHLLQLLLYEAQALR